MLHGEDTVRHVEKDELGAHIVPELQSALMKAYVGSTVNNAESTQICCNLIHCSMC